MINIYRLPGIMLLILMAGCTGLRTSTLSPTDNNTAGPTTLNSLSTALPATTIIKTTEPTGTLTLSDALTLALKRNSELKAFSYEVRASEAKAIQSGLRPNPEIEVEVEEYEFGASSNAFETAIVLSQLVELGGKRRKRLAVAEAANSLAGWDYETKRLDVFVETTKAFIDVLVAQKGITIAIEALELANKIQDVVDKRVQSGKVTPLEGNRARVELAMRKLELEQAKNNLSDARSQLGAMWGNSIPIFSEAAGQFDKLMKSIPSLESLMSELLSNPDIARWKNEIQMRRATVELERAVTIPDLSASAGIQQFEESGEDALTFGIAVALPIFDRNQGNIMAAEYHLSKADEEWKSALSASQASLIAMYNRLKISRMQALAIHDQILPAAEEVFKAATEGYLQGKFGYLEVLDAQRTMFEVTEKHVEALSSYHKAVVEVERLTGQKIKLK